MMRISNPGGIAPFQMPRAQAEPNEDRIGRTGQYDRIEITADKGPEEQRFARELASKISQEIRTSRHEEVAQLRQQVESGTYPFSAGELAARILLLGGIEA